MPIDDGVPGFDLYATLDVRVTASRAEIEAAYRARAKRDHPDTTDDPVGATARMRRLNLARAWLTDPVQRVRYDQIRGVGQPSGAPIPNIDPLGRWPDRPTTTSTARPDSAWSAVVMVALMINLASLVAGIGSNLLATVAFAVTGLILLIAGLLRLFGALRPLE